ncbi:hypothetical protein LCGC14_1820720 [marine sediment metagenome]|uniref:Uncharacterized protein n=1 Tax=marine sediment metagenome TaxID=412755 RepID=A0A0F9H781_9ZZZZ
MRQAIARAGDEPLEGVIRIDKGKIERGRFFGFVAGGCRGGFGIGLGAG